jgi:hypothetical protein
MGVRAETAQIAGMTPGWNRDPRRTDALPGEYEIKPADALFQPARMR